MKRKIHRTTLLVVAIILFTAAIGIVVLTNTDRIAVTLAPKKQAAKSRSENAKKADELFWQTFHRGEYENIQRTLDAHLKPKKARSAPAGIRGLHHTTSKGFS